MTYSVVFAPEANDQLEALYLYIAAHASDETAGRYTDAIIASCESLRTFPHRGLARDDIRPGLRITNHQGRTVIAFAVDEAAQQVSIIGVFYGGQNYETALGPDQDN
jgi:plasmid stabilization system protein ParE